MIARSAALLLTLMTPGAALADTAVPFGGVFALLNTPPNPKAAAILIPGGDGVLGIKADGTFSSGVNNQLTRTRRAYLAHGVATLVIDQGVDLPAAIAHMRKLAPVVAVVATSRGSLRVPAALSGKPDAVVLTASMLADVKRTLGTPAALPRTLVIHHRQDACRVTLPSEVEPFKAWGGAKVSVIWKTGGINDGPSCRAKSYHGFNGLDSDIVATVAQFVTTK
jgi:hypothetical protein